MGSIPAHFKGKNYLLVWHTSYFLSFLIISYVYRSFIPNKTTFTKYCLTRLDFKAPREIWNPSKAIHVSGKFHGSSGHSKCNSLQNRASFHRSLAWQIVLIFTLDSYSNSSLQFWTIWIITINKQSKKIIMTSIMNLRFDIKMHL